MKYAGRDKNGFNMRPQDADERGFLQDFIGRHIVCLPAPDNQIRFEVGPTVVEASPESEPKSPPAPPVHDAPAKAKPRKSDASH